jgi:hypothetical protein
VTPKAVILQTSAEVTEPPQSASVLQDVFALLPFQACLRSIDFSALRDCGIEQSFPAYQGDELSIFIGVLEAK